MDSVTNDPGKLVAQCGRVSTGSFATFYSGIDATDPFQGWEGVSKPLNAVPGGQVVLNTLREPDVPVFVPSFTMSCPESMWMGTEYLYMI